MQRGRRLRIPDPFRCGNKPQNDLVPQIADSFAWTSAVLVLLPSPAQSGGVGTIGTPEKNRSRMVYSRLRILITALGPRAFKPLPDGVGLKTANQAKSEGLVEADGELSAKTKYRLTPAGVAKKSVYGASRRAKIADG